MQFYCHGHILWFTDDSGHAVQMRDSLISYVNKVSTANFMAPHRFMIIIRMWDGWLVIIRTRTRLKLRWSSSSCRVNPLQIWWPPTKYLLAQTDTEGWKYLVVHIFALVMWSSKNCSRVLIYMCREIWKMSANKMQHFNEQLLLLWYICLSVVCARGWQELPCLRYRQRRWSCSCWFSFKNAAPHRLNLVSLWTLSERHESLNIPSNRSCLQY